MENLTLDLDQLTNDDFEGAVADAASYPEPPAPRPVAEGTYLVRPKAIGTDKDSQGQINKKAPQFLLHFEIVDGPDPAVIGRSINFIRISSRAYERQPGLKVSDLGDLVRAFNKAYNWQNNPGLAARYLQQQVDEGNTARIRFIWSAWDKTFWQQNNGDALDKDAAKDLRKQCSIKGMKKFNADGTVVGPSGETLNAKLVYGQAYPSKE